MAPATPYSGTEIFTFGPDASFDMVETVGSPTDVITSHNGTEQRIALRSLMVRRLKYTITLADDLQTMDVYTKLFNYVGQVFSVPMWSDAMVLLSAVPVGYVGSLFPVDRGGEPGFRNGPALLWSSAWVYEPVTIQGFHLQSATTMAWPAQHSVLVPLVQMMFDGDPTLVRGAAGLSGIELSFVADLNPWNA